MVAARLARHAFTYFILARYMRNISPNLGSALNTRNDFMRRYKRKSGKIASGVAVRGDSGVADEGRIGGVPKFHSWDKCTITLTNIQSNLMSNSLLGLCINLYYRIAGNFRMVQNFAYFA